MTIPNTALCLDRITLMFRTIFILLAITSSTYAVDQDHAKKMAESRKLFETNVRKVFADHCLECHGGKKTKSDFDLTTREKLIKGGDEDAGVVPGNHKASFLWKGIAHLVESKMPHKKPKLPDETIALIGKWIDLGAAYDRPFSKSELAGKAMAVTDEDRKFWSFRPLGHIEPPAVKNTSQIRTPIDRFVVAKLEAKGLAMRSLADRRKLIRRAYFDLIGLPPSPGEVEQFLNDKSSDAYSKLVDHLLDSPHYGERWARHWMDIARFAESHGFEQDYDRKHAYHYRDFLIKAFNQDMPYDQFVKWQLAGDELAPDNPLAWMATGFLGACVFPTQLTEKEFESSRYDELDDMVGTIGTSMLGLTIGCVRCHDHPYDPIPSEDYYRFVATFATTIRSEIDIDVDPAANKDAHKKFQAQIRKLESDLARFEKEKLPGLFDQYVAALKKGGPMATWQVLSPQSLKSNGGAKLEKQADQSVLATGRNPRQDVYTVVVHTNATGINAFRLEALTHKSMKRNGPGRAGNGNFVLGDIKVTAAPLKGGKAVNVKLVGAKATHQQNTGGLSIAASINDGKADTGWAVDLGGIGKDQAAVFETDTPVGFAGGTKLTFTMNFGHSNPNHILGRFRLALSTALKPVAIKDEGLPRPTGNVSAKGIKPLLDGAKPDAKQHAAAIRWYASNNSSWQALKKKIDDTKKRGLGVKKMKLQVTSEGVPKMKHHANGRGFPHFYENVYFLNRGNSNQKGEIAEQGFLQILMRGGHDEQRWISTPPKGWTRTSYRRASLANWMTDFDYGAGHLLARVIVNRLWQHHFGRGIVGTPSDFGKQGDPPTHPQLIDWLTSNFIASGWKLKRLHRQMMLSHVYMQDTTHDARAAKINNDNSLLWRRVPRRLEAEPIRDSLLAAANMLDRTMYGPGTLDQNMRRRSVYFFIKHSKLIPMMITFDWPEHLVSIGRRASTTIAPQALMFMNSPQARQYADGFAKRLNQKSVNDGIRQAYEIAFARQPGEQELAIGQAYIAGAMKQYELKKQGNALHLAWTDYCQALMSSNEFLYVE